MLFAAIVLVPILFVGHGELSRWQAALAFSHYDNGNELLAIEKLKRVTEELPNDWRLKLQLALWLNEAGQPQEAMELCERVLDNVEHMSGMTSNLVKMNVLQAKSSIQLTLDEPAAALATQKSALALYAVDEFSDSQRANQLAYFRALANEELDEADQQISQAIAVDDHDSRLASGMVIPLTVRAVIASALVARQTKEQKQLIPFLDRMIEDISDQASEHQLEFPQDVYEQMLGEFPLGKASLSKIASSQRLTVQLTDSLALLLTVRALVRQDLGELKGCDQDRYRIQALGWDADSIAKQLPDGIWCANSLNTAAAFLDTQAMVCFKMGQLERALGNQDLAVMAIQYVQKSRRTALQNSMQFGTDFRGEDRVRRRTEAILLYHRYQILRAKELFQLAEEDERRIKELGFELGSHLN
jgi:hypothetical protein